MQYFQLYMQKKCNPYCKYTKIILSFYKITHIFAFHNSVKLRKLKIII